jgi:hypothetical protein
VPAAAVIPAPIAYINVAAVKKLVVGSRFWVEGAPLSGVFTLDSNDVCWFVACILNRMLAVASTFTLKKLECSKQALQPEH